MIRVESIFSATFWAVPAPMRVEPATGSGPVSSSTAWPASRRRGAFSTLEIPMVSDITGCGEKDAAGALKKADGNVKLAVLVVKGLSPEDGRRLLGECEGNLRRTLDRLSP